MKYMRPLILCSSGPLCFSPGGTLNMLSVFWQFVAEVCFVKVPKDNEMVVSMFSLHTGYLVSQVLRGLTNTGLRWDVNTNQNKGRKLL